MCKIFAWSSEYAGNLKGKGRRVGLIWRNHCLVIIPDEACGGRTFVMDFFHIPCLCITLKNLTMTFELGRIRTWRFPAFSALLMALSASFKTLVLTMLTV